ANHVGGEDFCGGRDYFGGALESAGGERDVVGDHDIASPCPIRDPVVGDVGACIDQDEPDARLGGRADEGVGDDDHIPADAAADLVDFFLHGTGVGVDVDGGHGRGLAGGACNVQRSGLRLLRGGSAGRTARLAGAALLAATALVVELMGVLLDLLEDFL